MDGYPTIFDHPLVESIGWTLLHFVWVGTAIAVLAAGTLFLLRRKSARSRYRVAYAALVVIALAPAILLVRISSLPHGWDADTNALPAAVANRVLFASSTQPLKFDDLPHQDWLSAGAMLSTAAGKLVAWLALAWFGIGVVACILQLCGWLILHAAIRRSRQIAADCANRFRAIEKGLGLRRQVRYLVCNITDVPATVGLMHPTVLIPNTVLETLRADLLDSLVAHELAHIWRHDYAANFLQSFVDATLFFHPAVHWLSGRIRQERENCCDDLAASSVAGGKEAYAEALLRIEEIRTSAPRIALVASGGNLVDRIARLLGEKRRPRPAAGVVWLLVLSALLATAGRVTATTEGLRRSLYDQRAHSLSETVYAALDVPNEPDEGTKLLTALAQAVRSVPQTIALLHAVPAQSSLDRLADALNQPAANDILIRQALSRVNPREGWAFDERSDWPYGTPGQRLVLILSLWQTAQDERTSKAVLSRRDARAAILLCAQDYSEIGPATLSRLMGSPDTSRLLGLSEQSEKSLHDYLAGRQRASRIFFRLYLEAVMRYPSIFSESNLNTQREAFLELLRPLAAISVHRPELQSHLASLTSAADDSLRRHGDQSQGHDESLETDLQPVVGSEFFGRWVNEARSAEIPARMQLLDQPPPIHK